MTDRLINLELHCHTIYSKDGLMNFDSLVSTADLIGLGALAITDHDTIEGAKEFQRLARARNLDLQIIVGEERTLADGSHLIGIFLQEPIQSQHFEAVIKEIEEQRGLCLIPHPFRGKDGLLRNGLDPLQALAKRPAGFELFSAKCSFAENQRARDLLTTSLTPFGGSDAHYECDLGEGLNVISWKGDLKTSVFGMFERKFPFQILGKLQEQGAAERSYAPLYYRWKRLLKIPKPLLPMAKQCYRRYRNRKHGVGRKPLTQVYAYP